MKHVAIVIASRFGQTRRIAECMRCVLEEFDQCVRLFVVKDDGDLKHIHIDQFDAVVIGAPVYYGAYPAHLIKWTKNNASKLNGMSVSFFSVSLNAADKRLEARQEDRRLLCEFMGQTGVHLAHTGSFSGAVHYRRYGFFMRWLFRRLVSSVERAQARTRNHELTDWNDVKAFTMCVAQSLMAHPESVKTH